MRFFIALEIPEESKLQLKQVQAQLKELIPQARLTDNDKLHLTLAFVGEQPNELKEPVIQMMARAAQGIASFNVTPAYIDGFPRLHQAKVLWVGVKGDIDKLFIIQEKIKDGLVKLNLEVDERRYIPHIAVAKVSNFYLDPDTEKNLEEMMEKPFDSINISSIKLFESIPEEGFHRHNTLAEIQLSH